MANLLDDIGSALRIAGGVSSPQVADENARRKQQFEQIRAQRSQMILEIAARAAENGSLSPEGFQRFAQKYGVDAPAIGPSVQSQKAQAELLANQDLQRRRQLFQNRNQPTDISGPSNIQGVQAEAINVKGQHTPFDAYMKDAEDAYNLGLEDEAKRAAEMASLELKKRDKETDLGALIRERDALPEGDPRRKIYDEAIARKSEGGGAGTQFERALATLQRLQLQVNGGQPLLPEQQLEAETARAILEQQRMSIDPATMQPIWSQPLTVPPSISVGRSTGKPTPNVMPPLTGGRKPLDAGTEKEVAAMGDGRSQLNALSQEFNDDFGGFASETLGRGAVEIGRRIPGSPYEGMANWWQRYEQYITDVRAAKFGMTLTGYELQQFNRYRVNPGDTPKLIKENLRRQAEVLEGAMQRRLNSIARSGQNLQQAEALIGKEDEGKEINPLKKEEEPQISDGLQQEGDRWVEYKKGKPVYRWPSKEAYEAYRKATGG